MAVRARDPGCDPPETAGWNSLSKAYAPSAAARYPNAEGLVEQVSDRKRFEVVEVRVAAALDQPQAWLPKYQGPPLPPSSLGYSTHQPLPRLGVTDHAREPVYQPCRTCVGPVTWTACPLKVCVLRPVCPVPVHPLAPPPHEAVPDEATAGAAISTRANSVAESATLNRLIGWSSFRPPPFKKRDGQSDLLQLPPFLRELLFIQCFRTRAAELLCFELGDVLS